VRSDLIAEEATQDAFVQAFKNLRKFKGKAAFSTWFYRIVVNESLKKNRKKKLQFVGISESEIGETIPDIYSHAIEPFHEEEQRELIEQVLEKLKETEALLLKLFYLEEKKIDEIVEITGLTPSNCKVILFRARKKFAEYYRLKVNQ
jgi:RNA polymerase sigma-70 factor (ECF subfamily)